MIKKFLTSLIIFLIFFSLYFSISYSFQDEDPENFELSEIEETLQTISNSSNYPDTNSKHIIVLDRKSGRILFEKDGFSKTPMASTTKILTAIIAIENCDLNENVIISSNASSINGSTVGIKQGTNRTLNDLLYGLMLKSGNDCAIAIAEHIAGNVENFSDIMNKKVLSLGLKDSHFTSPHGLDNENHYTTAYELALITNYALKNSTFAKIVSCKEATIKLGDIPITISNTNELLGNFDGVYGVKTGFTFNSGRCLVTACNRNNFDVISVVLGADTKKFRTLDTIRVLNYVYKNYQIIDISNIIYDEFYKFENYYTNTVKIEKSNTKPIIKIKNISNTVFPLKREEINSISTETYSLNFLHAPINVNSKIGEINIKLDNEILLYSEIILSKIINRKKWKY